MDKQERPTIMVVAAKDSRTDMLAENLMFLNTRVVEARNASEANELIHDIRFLELELEAIIIDEDLQINEVAELIARYRNSFPEGCVALLTNPGNRRSEIWYLERGITAFEKPGSAFQVANWIRRAKSARMVAVAQ